MASRIFLSYAREDADEVDRIRAELVAAGHDVWVDTTDLRGGDHWRAGIVAGIEQADSVVVVLSRSSVGSDHVLTEVQIASEQRTRIVPVRLEDAKVTGGLRYSLSGLQETDLATDPKAGLQALLAALDPTLRVRTTQSPSPSPPPLRSRYWTWIAGAVGSVGVVVVLVLIFGGGGDSLPPETCFVTIDNPLVSLNQDPDRFSLELRRVPTGDHIVIDSTIVTFGLNEERWLLIEVEGQQGWIEASGFNVAAISSACNF